MSRTRHWFNDRTRKMEIIIVRVHTRARNREQSPHSGSKDVELTVKTTCYLAVTCRTMITDDDNDELIERGDYSRSNTGKTHIIVSHIYTGLSAKRFRMIYYFTFMKRRRSINYWISSIFISQFFNREYFLS